VSIVGFKASNHPQQVGKRGARSDVDDRATHPDDFRRWDERFGFTLDVAAAAHNAKCDRYFSIEDNGLIQSWADERVWCNPPYSDIEPWVNKAWIEAPETQLIVMLLPANRTEQGWWQRWVEPFRDGQNAGGITPRVEFLSGRLRFIQAGRTDVGPNERPPFGCCLLIWSNPRTPPTDS
jgi:phage N-6-adenine-methyltransferase